MNAQLPRSPIATELDAHRQAFLYALARLARAHPDLAQQEAEATASAMQQVVWLEAPHAA